jgi:hypothetical protein
MAKIKRFVLLAETTVTWKDIISLHSSSQHITFVFKEGRLYLTALIMFSAKFPNNLLCKHHVPKSFLNLVVFAEHHPL